MFGTNPCLCNFVFGTNPVFGKISELLLSVVILCVSNFRNNSMSVANISTLVHVNGKIHFRSYSFSELFRHPMFSPISVAKIADAISQSLAKAETIKIDLSRAR